MTSIFIGKFADRNKAIDAITSNSKDLYLEIDGSCVVTGERGSGKTVLSKGIAEGSIINGIPVLVIDPKGDLAQLACPSKVGCLFGLTEKEATEYEEKLKRFGISEWISKYIECVQVHLYDHTFPPTKEDAKSIFTKMNSSKAPLTIIRLLSQNEEDNIRAVRSWLNAIRSSLDDLSGIVGDKILVIDEVHRYLHKGSDDIYNTLETILRESRNSKLRVIFITHKQEDLGKLVSYVKYRFDFVDKAKCIVSYRPATNVDFTQISYPEVVVPHWIVTVHKEKSMTANGYKRARDFWDIRIHPETKFINVDAIPVLYSFDEVDLNLINFLNSQIVLLDFASSETVLNDLNTSLDQVTKIFSNKEFRDQGHYHALLDFEKLGYPILAFFVCKSEEPRSETYYKGIRQIIDSTNTFELFEISSPKEYVDVDLLAKFRFRNMHEYYDLVANNLLQISRRGKSEEERLSQFIKEFLSGLMEKGIHNLPLPDPLPKEYIPKIPPEQLVSGCIFTKTFSEHATCYIDRKIIKTLDMKQHESLRNLAEITYPEKPIPYDVDYIYGKIKQQLPSKFTKDDLQARIERMVNLGIIKGAYLELPWKDFGYNTAFVIGQLNLKQVDSEAKKIQDHHNVQEVHTIVGTYDVLVKIRYGDETEFGSVLSHIHNIVNPKKSIVLKATSELKHGYRLKAT